MNLNFTPQARADLVAIHEYIARDNPPAADSVIQRILQSIAILEFFPLLGRVGKVSDTREFSISNLPYFSSTKSPMKHNSISSRSCTRLDYIRL